MKLKFSKVIILLVTILAISACANTKNATKVDSNKSAEQIYNEAMDLLMKKRYLKAATSFEQVELEHPYSKWAIKSKIMSAFAYYSKNKYSDAIIALERFIKLHPGNEEAPYAYYLLAICYYEQISDIGRDQSITEKAHNALQQLIKRFPSSKYANDARKKLKLTIDHLAGKEMEIGRYYQKQQKYIAAINRFNIVINNYEETTHIEEALYRLTETYTILGMDKEALANAKVLSFNYPKSKWYKKAYNLINKKEKKLQKAPIKEDVKKEKAKEIKNDEQTKEIKNIAQNITKEKIINQPKEIINEKIKTIEPKKEAEEKIEKTIEKEAIKEENIPTHNIQYIYK